MHDYKVLVSIGLDRHSEMLNILLSMQMRLAAIQFIPSEIL